MRGTDGHRHADSRSSRAASSHSPIARRDEPGPKISLTPCSLSIATSPSGITPPPEDHDVIESAVLQLSDDAREEGEMRARQQREPDAIRILLEDGLGDLFGSLMQPGVDDLEPMVPESSGDGLGTAIMTVKARLRNDDSVGAFHEPQTLRNHWTISPTARTKPDASLGVARRNPGHTCQNGSVVSAPQLPELRSPFARAVVPVLGGVVFFVLLGLITWGIAAFLSSGDTETTDNLAPPRLELGSAAGRANDVAEAGPLLFAELSTITGARSLVVDHEGDDPANGWRLYYAFPPGRPDCPCRAGARLCDVRRL